MIIEKINIDDSGVGQFINKAFTEYAKKRDVILNYEEYCYIAENEECEIIGAITGQSLL